MCVCLVSICPDRFERSGQPLKDAALVDGSELGAACDVAGAHAIRLSWPELA